MMLCLGANGSWAQSDRGSIVGRVTDSAGAVLRGAQVTLTDDEQKSVIKYLNEQFYKFK
jgi:hypothetical protein